MNWSDIHVPSVVAGAVAGFAVGGCAGYFVSRRWFATRLDSEVASIKAHYNSKAKEWLERGRPYVGPRVGKEPVQPAVGSDVARIGMGDAVADPALEPADDEAGDAADAIGFDQHHSPDMPWPALNRNTDVPYKICACEFGEEFPEYQTLSIVWYEGDKVLADDQEAPIRDVVGTVGPVSRAIFGGVSDDDNIAYVRNDKLHVDFEIAWDNRSYADVILNYGNPNRRDR